MIPEPATRAAVADVPEWVDRAAYPFTPRTADLAAGRLSYVDEGQGDPILFVHGTPSWSFEYRHLITRLSRAHRCVAVDHLGFGLSERPESFDYTPQSHARNLAEVVDALGLRHFTLVVHDFGGPIALPLALARPARVRRLVVLNTWMWSLADDPSIRRVGRLVRGRLGRFLYGALNFPLRVLTPGAYGDRRKLTKATHAQYRAPFPDAASRTRVLWPLARALLDSSDLYDSLWQRRAALADIPALIIWGMKDRALGPHLLERWRAALPRAEVCPLPDAGHWPHEERPRETARLVGEFVVRSARRPLVRSGGPPDAH